jgi:hypothetical protein
MRWVSSNDCFISSLVVFTYLTDYHWLDGEPCYTLQLLRNLLILSASIYMAKVDYTEPTIAVINRRPSCRPVRRPLAAACCRRSPALDSCLTVAVTLVLGINRPSTVCRGYRSVVRREARCIQPLYPWNFKRAYIATPHDGAFRFLI